jgi:hypothetical protein
MAALASAPPISIPSAGAALPRISTVDFERSVVYPLTENIRFVPPKKIEPYIGNSTNADADAPLEIDFRPVLSFDGLLVPILASLSLQERAEIGGCYPSAAPNKPLSLAVHAASMHTPSQGSDGVTSTNGWLGSPSARLMPNGWPRGPRVVRHSGLVG